MVPLARIDNSSIEWSMLLLVLSGFGDSSKFFLFIHFELICIHSYMVPLAHTDNSSIEWSMLLLVLSGFVDSSKYPQRKIIE